MLAGQTVRCVEADMSGDSKKFTECAAGPFCSDWLDESLL